MASGTADSTRCYLVYALAPEGIPAAEANRLFNEYIADERRGLVAGDGGSRLERG